MVNKVNIKTAIYHKIVTNYTKITVFYSVEGKKKTSAVGFKYPAGCCAGDDFLAFSF